MWQIKLLLNLVLEQGMKIFIALALVIDPHPVYAQSWLSSFCKHAGHASIEVYQIPSTALSDFELHGKIKGVTQIDSFITLSVQIIDSNRTPFPPPQKHSLQFDPDGRLQDRFDTTLFESDSSIYRYDAKGRLTGSRSKDNLGREFLHEWTYDDQGRLLDAVYFSPDRDIRSHLTIKWDSKNIPSLIDSSGEGVCDYGARLSTVGHRDSSWDSISEAWDMKLIPSMGDQKQIGALHIDYPFGRAHIQWVVCSFDTNGSLISIRDSNNGLTENTWYYDTNGYVIVNKKINHVDDKSPSYTLDFRNARGELVETREQSDSIATRDSSNVKSWSRFSYKYDDHGNWVERLNTFSDDPNTALLSRRRIEY